MDLQSNLIESMKQKQKGGWKASVASIVVHGGIVAAIVVLSASATHRVNAEDKPIRAFITQTAAPPPPPPPPPPAASSARKATSVKPVEVPKQTFVQPRQVPKEVPQVDPTPAADTTTSTDNAAPSDGGVAGGVPGGVPGGVAGGQIGGVVGGQIGGVVGGVLGGQIGGTGSTEAAPAKPDGPLRVGGDVKAPVVTHRVDPIYPEMARKGRIAGVVIIEAIIDKNGDVQDAKVLKGLPMGLSDSAVAAVKQWHFKPGTMNGEPVEVIFDLTVNFKVD